MFSRVIAVALFLVSCAAGPLGAQLPDSGTVNVTVREAMGMVDGILIRSETDSAITDANGRARLVLPSGQRTLTLTRIGFIPKRVTVTVIADSAVSLTVDIAMEGAMPTMEAVRVSATRLERLVEKTP